MNILTQYYEKVNIKTQNPDRVGIVFYYKKDEVEPASEPDFVLTHTVDLRRLRPDRDVETLLELGIRFATLDDETDPGLISMTEVSDTARVPTEIQLDLDGMPTPQSLPDDRLMLELHADSKLMQFDLGTGDHVIQLIDLHTPSRMIVPNPIARDNR